MNRLWKRDKDKAKEQQLQPPPREQTPLSTPIHQQFSSRQSADTADQWEILEQHASPLLPGVSPAVPSPTRSPSPYTTAPNKQPPQTLRKKTPPALVVLSSLDPIPQGQQQAGHIHARSEDRPSENGHGHKEKDKNKGGGFWNRNDKDKDRDREREREREMEQVTLREREREVRERERDRDRGRDEENELTRKIGFLTATASEDWTLVLDVCDHASANETNAKEAVRALRREFKYGEPAAQLAAARLWAIMLRNSSDVFISQSTSRKFLDTLEDLLTSSRTSPVVRERVMDVLAAAAYASGTKKDTGFRGLWRRVKPKDKPEEGVPFDTEDAMFNPPLSGSRMSTNEFDNIINVPTAPGFTFQDATPIVSETPPTAKPPTQRKRKTSENRPPGEGKPHREREHRSRDHGHRIIPPDEDMRRLFQECKIGVGNAALLSQALAMATPEDLDDPVIMEFHKKCIDSQELIFTQIPWASAGAERSQLAKEQQEREMEDQRNRKISTNTLNMLHPESQPELAVTKEEELLADLLAANEQLLEALKQFDDLKRVAVEREAEDRSRREVRMDPRQRQYLMEDGMLHADEMGGGGSSSRSRSPSPARAPVPHPLPSHPSQVGGAEMYHSAAATLAPPPAAPHGPRLPGAAGAGSGISRTPSPAQADAGEPLSLANGLAAMRVGGGSSGGSSGHTREYAAASTERGSFDVYPNANGRPSYDEPNSDDEGFERPVQPSAKALGKRRVVADPNDFGQSGDDDASMAPKDHLDDRLSDSDDEHSPAQYHAQHPATQYVYDAVAERTEQRLREGHMRLVNGVH